MDNLFQLFYSQLAVFYACLHLLETNWVLHCWRQHSMGQFILQGLVPRLSRDLVYGPMEWCNIFIPRNPLHRDMQKELAQFFAFSVHAQLCQPTLKGTCPCFDTIYDYS